MITETQPGLDELAGCLERLVGWLRRSTAIPGYSVTSRLTLTRLYAGGPARISDLARAEGVTQPAMTGLVNRLEGEGLVARSADPTDARAALVALTAAGRAFVEARRAERVRVLSARVERLPDADRRAILAALPALDRLSNLPDRPDPDAKPVLDRRSNLPDRPRPGAKPVLDRRSNLSARPDAGAKPAVDRRSNVPDPA